MTTQIGIYKIIESIGKGSFGEVYLAQDPINKKLVAIKKVSNNNGKLEKYLDYEIKIMKMLNHPNIVKFEGKITLKNNTYIAMEYVNGGSLSDLLKNYKLKYGKPFDEQIVQYLMKQIISALIHIHGYNIIHRDLKLDNIMVHFDSEKDKKELNVLKAKIKIIDFGFAIILPNEASLTNSAVGTFIYMDPKILDEFCRKALVSKSNGYGKEVDIWSLGIICYELLRGKKPFDGTDLHDLFDKIKNKGQYRLPKTVSKEIFDFLDKMLKYDGKKRLSALELLKQPFITKNISDFQSIVIPPEQIEYQNEFKIKDSIEIYKQKLNSKKQLQKLNSLPDMPIKEEDSINKTQESSNKGFHTYYSAPITYTVNMNNVPLNPQPQMQNGMYNYPINPVGVNLNNQSFPPQYPNPYIPGNQYQFPSMNNLNYNIHYGTYKK